MTDKQLARLFLPILAVLYVMGFVNLFLRATFGIMAPHIAVEMRLEPWQLSAVASSYFIAYALMQLPTGVLLDRFGANRTLSVMMLFTTAGVALFAMAPGPEVLAFARVLIGVGCAGVFTGAFFVLALWQPKGRVVTSIGLLNSFASLGSLVATTPLAILIATIGWRMSFAWFAFAVGLLLTAIALVVRDQPPGAMPREAGRETLREALSGVGQAVRQPGMTRLLVAGLPMSASTTIIGVWGAPYLRDVHGLDDIGRGNVLFALALFGMSGHLVHARIARHLNSLKSTVLIGATVIILTTAALALVARPPLWLVVVLFCVIGVAANYPTIIMGHARGLVPATVMGRGVAAANMGSMTAIASMQLVFGWIVGLFPAAAGIPPEHAYRAGFAAQALLALAAMAIYAPIRDVQPKD